MDTFELEDFGFFTSSDNVVSPQETAAMTTASGASDAIAAATDGGFDLDFGDWGMDSSSSTAMPTTDAATTSHTNAASTESQDAASDGFDFNWGTTPSSDVEVTVTGPTASQAVEQLFTPVEAPAQPLDPQMISIAPTAPMAFAPPPPLVPPISSSNTTEPPAKKHRGDMPPPSPMPPRQLPPQQQGDAQRSRSASQQPAPHQQGPRSGGAVAAKVITAPVAVQQPAQRQPQAAVKAIQQQGISRKAVDELLAEADDLLRDVCGAPSNPPRLSDAAFRSSIAAAKKRAEEEAELLANRTSELFKVTVANLDRLGPNPHITSLLGGSTLHATTPVVHLIDALKTRLTDKMRSIAVAS